jgi:hypothetical protein
MVDILGMIANPQMADIAGAIDYREKKLAEDEAKRKEIRTNQIMGKALSSGLREGSLMHQLAKENPSGYLTIAKHMGIDPSDGNGMHQMTVDVNTINKLAKTDPQQAIDYMMSEKDHRSKLGLNTDYLDKGLAAAQANAPQFFRAVEISDQTWNPPSAKEDFTLGDTRYDGNGEVIASNPRANEMTPFQKAQVDHWNNPVGDGSDGLSEDAKNMLADRLLQGEKSGTVLGNIGRGAQGAADLRDIQNMVAEKAKGKGVDANKILQNTQNVYADNRTFLELGAREGKIASRVAEANLFAKIALESSKQVDRDSFVPWNKLSNYGSKQLSDPKLAALHAATQSLVNAYASAVGGGQMTEAGRKEANEMLYEAQGPEAYNAVVNQMLVETQAALDSPKMVREHMHAPKENKKSKYTIEVLP